MHHWLGLPGDPEGSLPFLPKVGHWNRFPRNSAGALIEECCPFFDLMRWSTGRRLDRVYASGGMDVNHSDERDDGKRPDILDNAFVMVDFQGGVRAILDLCMLAEVSRNQEGISAAQRRPVEIGGRWRRRRGVLGGGGPGAW